MIRCVETGQKCLNEKCLSGCERLLPLKSFCVIQDVKTKEYFFRYRIDEDFTPDLKEATQYENGEEAFRDLNEEAYNSVFSGRTVEIKNYYKIKE